MSCGSGDRGISGSEKRARISDHLFEPGIQDELAAHVHCAAVYYGDGAVCSDRSGGETVSEAILKSELKHTLRHFLTIELSEGIEKNF